MVQQVHFNASFGALSDATRRGVLEQLGRADASITALAERFQMTLTGMKKHVGVLEKAGLVTTEKVGRVRTCRLGIRGLEEEAAWIERHRQLWAARFDALDKVVEELKRKEKQMEVTREDKTRVERISDLELVVTRTVNAPARLVFEAWTKAELFRSWWVPKSYGLNLVSCTLDVRVGGQYRLAFLHEGSTMEFFGTYLEVTPDSRLVWTNEEGDAGQTVTTVTFEETAGKTRLTVSNLYPSKEALEADGSTAALPEVLDQLEEILASLGSRSETK